jgi:hypothetical protein
MDILRVCVRMVLLSGPCIYEGTPGGECVNPCAMELKVHSGHETFPATTHANIFSWFSMLS